MRPIPMSLLPSTMVWKAPKGGRSGAGEFEDGRHTLAHVRLVSSQGTTVRDATMHDPAAGTVFVDAVHSTGELPPLGALASIDGAPGLVVRSVQRLYGRDGRLHHAEIGVG